MWHFQTLLSVVEVIENIESSNKYQVKSKSMVFFWNFTESLCQSTMCAPKFDINNLSLSVYKELLMGKLWLKLEKKKMYFMFWEEKSINYIL